MVSAELRYSYALSWNAEIIFGILFIHVQCFSYFSPHNSDSVHLSLLKPKMKYLPLKWQTWHSWMDVDRMRERAYLLDKSLNPRQHLCFDRRLSIFSQYMCGSTHCDTISRQCNGALITILEDPGFRQNKKHWKWGELQPPREVGGWIAIEDKNFNINLHRTQGTAVLWCSELGRNWEIWSRRDIDSCPEKQYSMLYKQIAW